MVTTSKYSINSLLHRSFLHFFNLIIFYLCTPFVTINRRVMWAIYIANCKQLFRNHLNNIRVIVVWLDNG